MLSIFFQESLQKGGVKVWSVKLNKSLQEVELKALLFVVFCLKGQEQRPQCSSDALLGRCTRPKCWPKLKPRLFFSRPSFSEMVAFFRDNFSRNWSWNLQKIDKSLETEKFRNRNVTLCAGLYTGLDVLKSCSPIRNCRIPHFVEPWLKGQEQRPHCRRLAKKPFSGDLSCFYRSDHLW